MNKRRILISTLIGTIALTGLSVSLTLAWYGASDRLNVRPLEVSVAGTTDLKVSTSPDIDSFVSSLDLTPSEEFVFTPVSTLARNDWEDVSVPEFFDCSYQYVPYTGEPTVDKAKAGFFQQKLYLLTNLNYYVTLDVNPNNEQRENKWSTFKNNDDANTNRAQDLQKLIKKDLGIEMSIQEIKDKLDKLVDCLRVSILVKEEENYNYYIIDPTKARDEVTVFGGRLDNDGDGYYDTYIDANGDLREVVYGEINDRTKVQYLDPEDPEYVNEQTINESFFWDCFHAESNKKAFTYDETESFKEGLEFAKENAFSLDELDSETTKLLIPCYANKPTEIVLSIYLEGWDTDCINSTMGASFVTNLSFKLLRGIIG